MFSQPLNKRNADNETFPGSVEDRFHMKCPSTCQITVPLSVLAPPAPNEAFRLATPTGENLPITLVVRICAPCGCRRSQARGPPSSKSEYQEEHASSLAKQSIKFKANS